jgi:hypothetical protein
MEGLERGVAVEENSGEGEGQRWSEWRSGVATQLDLS